MAQKQVQRIDIQLDPDVASGEYANFVVVTHSPAEFVMDFTRFLPGIAKARIHSRIVMAPPHAKAFMKALTENISRFEQKYGEIKLQEKESFGAFGVAPPDVVPN